tara:strand:- start:660 stop:1337 length:678 start_codon:yes stop_codon:yes gene_type:complete
MASSITGATMTVTIKESVIVNGVEQGSTNVTTYSNIRECNRRIVTIPTSEKTILSIGTAVGPGTFIESDVRYIRITNKDDAHFVRLVFKNEFDHEFCIKLDPEQTFIFNADRDNGVADTFTSNDKALAFNDATCDYDNDPTVTCDASTSIIAGSRVAGTGVVSGTTVASVNTAGAVTSFELSASTTGGAQTNNTLGFAAGLADLVSITAEADTASVDIEMFVAQI